MSRKRLFSTHCLLQKLSNSSISSGNITYASTRYSMGKNTPKKAEKMIKNRLTTGKESDIISKLSRDRGPGEPGSEVREAA